MPKPTFVGQKHHLLTIIKQYSTKKHIRFICICDCGNETDVRKDAIIGPRAETKSCGCYQHRHKKVNTPKEDAVTKLWLAARGRSRVAGCDFTIEKSDIHIPDICPLLKIEIVPGANDRHSSPSLDRKDNSKGYTPDNIWVISTRANLIKNDSNGDELLTLAKALIRHGL